MGFGYSSGISIHTTSVSAQTTYFTYTIIGIFRGKEGKEGGVLSGVPVSGKKAKFEKRKYICRSET